MAGLKLFVTGGAGFIGSNFILYWMRHHPEDELVNFDLLTYAGNLFNLKAVESDARYRFVHGDICDPTLVKAAMELCDVVVHFAAESHVDRSIMDALPFVRTNVLGTQVLLDAVMHTGVKKFVHISTDEVFGSLDLDDSRKFNEHSAYAPRNPYSASKAGGDMLVRSYGATFGLPYVIINCGNNYGPRQFPEKFVPLMIVNALENKPVPVYGDGKYVRDWVYVEDHCAAIEAIILSDKIGETYCIGGEEKKNIEIVEEILAILKKPTTLISHVKDRLGHDRRYALDSSKIRRELDWAPRETISGGLKKTVDWYINNQDWLNNVRTEEYRAYYEKQYHRG